MHQIAHMMIQSNARMEKILKKGGFNEKEIMTAQREAEVQIKIINAAISVYAVNSKNQRAIKGLEKMNLIDETTAVDLGLGDPEADKVKCPVKKMLIPRGECLDFSGGHYDECSGCDIGAKSKERLLPDPINP